MTTQDASAPAPTNGKYQYSKPSFNGELVLNTEKAKAFGGNRFDQVMTGLFIIDVVARQLAKNLKTYDHKAVAAAVSTKIGEVEKIVSDETARITALLGPRAEKLPNYSNPLVRSYEITSPEIARFARLLSDFDKLMMLIDVGWLDELIDSDDADQFREEKERQIQRLIRYLYGTGQSARSKAYASKSAEAAQLKADIEKAEAREQVSKNERAAAGILEPKELDAIEQIEAHDGAHKAENAVA